MGTSTIYFHRQQSYTCAEIMVRWAEVKKKYADAILKKGKKGNYKIYFSLQPTENSIKYQICISVRLGKPSVKVYPIAPKIPYYNGKIYTPHMYMDGSLCLYFPKYNEWNSSDSWAETIIPWVAVWLYYYEIWLMTGEWLGGGIHPGQEKKID